MLAYSFLMTFLVGVFFGIFLLGSVFVYLVQRDDKKQKMSKPATIEEFVQRKLFDQDTPSNN